MNATRTNLRPDVTTFVGREKELAVLGALLARPARLVSLLGPPGIGKTRLAVSTLRKLGLGEICQSHGEGYRLDPTVAICRV